jgi:biotin synthase
VLPATVVRLSAGRTNMSQEGQALCFLAGAGSIFAGDKLLTTPNPAYNDDMELLNILGMKPKQPVKVKVKNPEIMEKVQQA